MKRCDFSSISTCLKNQISESNQMSQPDFLYELFEDFMDDPANQDFSMDNGLVCRWMTGQAKISPKNIRLLFQAILYSAIKRNRGYERSLTAGISILFRGRHVPDNS